jgi:hypothetical protein
MCTRGKEWEEEEEEEGTYRNHRSILFFDLKQDQHFDST